MSVFTSMRQREPRWIGEAERLTVHDLGSRHPRSEPSRDLPAMHERVAVPVRWLMRGGYLRGSTPQWFYG